MEYNSLYKEKKYESSRNTGEKKKKKQKKN